MHIELDIDLISNAKKPPFLLSFGYGNGHVVVQIDGDKTIDDLLTFIANHRDNKAACWTEFGHFASCSVTLTLSSDLISIVVGTDISAGSFGQSAGIYIPKDHLGKFIAGLKNAQEKMFDGNISEAIEKASKTWSAAATTLDIRVTAPFSVLVGTENLQCVAHIHDFGSPQGTIVGVLHPETMGTNNRLQEYAKQHGMFCSFVNPLGWVKYNEATVKEALDDWGYFGPSDKCPAWFKGIKYDKSTGNVTQ